MKTRRGLKKQHSFSLLLLLAGAFLSGNQSWLDWSAATGAQCVPAPAGLVGWWRGEGNANDSAGFNDGTTPFGIDYASGEVGQAFKFNGTNTRVDVPDSTDFQLVALTIEGWIHPQEWGGVVFWRGNSQVDAFQLDLSLAGNVALRCNTATNGPVVLLAPVELSQWQHIAGTLDGTTGDMKLYLNGVLAAQTNAALRPLVQFISQLQTGVAIGNQGSVYLNLAYNGLADEISLYGRALSQSEVQAIYNAGAAGKCLPLLLPLILSHPTNFTVTAGSTARFSVEARSDWPLSYQWFFASNAIPGQIGRSLVLSNVQSGADGNYFVNVSNTNGTVTSSNALLTVLTYPPVVISQPQGTNAYVGATVTIQVGVTGSPPLSYQWRREGSAIGGAVSNTYNLAHAQTNDSGNYSVVVTNLYGAQTSSIAVLNVRVPPPCIPPPEGLVSWWRAEGNPLDGWGPNDGLSPYPTRYGPGKVGQAFNSFVLVPDSASLHFTNGLTIQAWVNPVAVVQPLPIPGPPRTIVGKWDYPTFQSPAQSSFYLGLSNNNQLYFAVTPNGSPRTNTTVHTTARLATNQWSLVTATYDGAALRLYLNGDLAGQTAYAANIFPGTDNLGIGGNPEQQGFGGVLPFPGSIDEVCLYNRALAESEIQAVFEADVTGLCLEPPTIVAQPQSQTIPLGEDVLFSVSILGTRPLRYHWFFDGRPLAAATNASLILEKVQTNQVGNYSVMVSNTLGSALSSNATLALLPAPTCVQPPPGAISWWPADNSVIDAVGTNNVTIRSQLSSFAPGKVGLAFSNSALFPGTIEAANSPSLNFSSNADFAIEAWIKAVPPRPAATPFPFLPPPVMGIVHKGPDLIFPANSSPGYSLFLSEGRLACWLGAGLRGLHSARFVSAGPDLRDSLFHHVALSLQRNATNGGKLYVDGALVLMFDPTAERGDLSNPYQLLIGSGGERNATFTGLIDELAIYNRALTAEEILAIRQAGAAGKCKVRPFIIAQPANQIVQRGGTATFGVGAGGTPTLRYQWTFKSMPTQPAVSIRGATHPSLTVTNVQAANTGYYSVIINNAFGETFSSNALLKLDRPPVANCANMVVPADSYCVAHASIDAGSQHPDGYPLTLVQSPPGPYPLGTNLVTLTAIDPYGASNSCSALVVVLDTTPPTILCADILVTNAHNALSRVVPYNPTVIDNCLGVGQPVCNPPSGSVFGLGAHAVICTAVDAVGNSNQCTFRVIVQAGNVPPVPVIEVSPLASFPGYTNLIIIAPDGLNANVTFDGSKSYDLDDPAFHYFWYEGTNLFSTNVVATRVLSMGSHEIRLWLDDTFPLGTNSVTVTVEVISPAQAVGIVMELLDNSDLGPQQTKPLVASLNAAAASFDRGKTRAAVNQLGAFQNKVRAQVAPSEPDLADDLARSAQSIIDAVRTK